MIEIVFLDKADAVLSFRPDAELQARIEELAARSTEGHVTEAECAEYEGYVRANKFVSILQRQVRRLKHRCEYCQLRQDDSPLALVFSPTNE